MHARVQIFLLGCVIQSIILFVKKGGFKAKYLYKLYKIEHPFR